jgi:predicted transposase YdaD
MPVSPSEPHDRLTKFVLGVPENAASELRAVLPAAVAERVDWTVMQRRPGSFVSSELKSRHSDLVFRTRIDGREGYLFAVIEHQSGPDPLMAFRMAEYQVCLWADLLRENPGMRVLPPIVSCVLYTGGKRGRRWNSPRELSELIDAGPELRAALGEHLPRLRYFLDDITTVGLEQLCAREATAETIALLAFCKVDLEAGSLVDQLGPALPALRAILASPRARDVYRACFTYAFSVAEVDGAALDALAAAIGPVAKEALMTTAERLEAKGRAEGEARGEARGRAVGEAKGRTAILVRLLVLKFGDLPEQKIAAIHNATPDQVLLWTDRILTAGTLDEVFTPEAAGEHR